MLTSSDLLNPPANPSKINALSLIFSSLITLIINFKSLINIGFYSFCLEPKVLLIPCKFSIITGCLVSK